MVYPMADLAAIDDFVFLFNVSIFFRTQLYPRNICGKWLAYVLDSYYTLVHNYIILECPFGIGHYG
jgi:hypothetical protein